MKVQVTVPIIFQDNSKAFISFEAELHSSIFGATKMPSKVILIDTPIIEVISDKENNHAI